VLVIVDKTEMREVVAIELQLSVTPAISGTLLPFSNARRRALFQRQRSRIFTNPPCKAHVLQKSNPPE
jgi:hypothetical protein